MSRPKTGSVTAVAPSGENGTWCAQSRIVSHAGRQRAADGQGDQHRHDHEAHARDRRQVGQVVGVEDERPGLAERGWAGPSPAAGVRGRRIVDPVDDAPQAGLRRSAGGGLSRAARARLPSRTTRASTRPPMNSRACDPTRVQKTPSKWTLAYHSASVHRSIPNVNSTNSTMSAATMTQRPMRRPRPIPRAVVGAAWTSPAADRLRRRPAGGRLLLGPVRRRRRRIVRRLASSRSSSSSGSRSSGSTRFGGFGASGRAPPAPALRAGAAPPGSRRTGRASSAESSRYRPQGRWRPSIEGRNAARTVSASSLGRIVAARAGSKRNAARIDQRRRATDGPDPRAGRASRGASAAGRRPRGSARTAPRRSTGRAGPAADRAAGRRSGRRRGS